MPEKPLVIDSGYLRKEGMGPIDDNVNFWDNNQGLIKEWQKAGGYDSVILKDSSGRSMAAISDPTKIRSVNAAFDPAKKDSSNLLAEVLGGAVLTGAVASERAEAREAQKRPHFVERANNPSIFPNVDNGDGTHSSHRMAAEVDENGQWWSFPTVVQNKDGSFRQFEDPFEALRYNQNTGNALKMPSKEAALEYSEGGYKKGQFWDMIKAQQK